MRKIVIGILSMFLIFSFAGCSGQASDDANASTDAIRQESAEKNQNSPETATSTDSVIQIPAEIPESLIFADNGNGTYSELFLGEWDAFLKRVFKDYEYGEVDPGSGITKYFGEGNDGYGYCFLVTTRSSNGAIISYNIDTAIVSESPNSGGDEVDGQDMVRWIYENFGVAQ